jgi:GAF domain-containing protein
MNQGTGPDALRRGGRRAQAWVDTPAGLLLLAGTLRRRGNRLADAPLVHAVEHPRAQSPGHDVDRIIIVAAGSGQGWGNPVSDLALCSELATAISHQTHRGCEVELVANQGAELADVVALLDSTQLDRRDVVIVAVGVNDAVGRVSVSRWQAGLNQTVAALRARTAVSTEIVVVGIPRLRSIAAFDSPLGGVADRHARRLDHATVAFCVHTERASYLSMADSADVGIVLGDPRWLSRVADRVSQRLALHYEIDGDRRHRRPSEAELLDRLTMNGIPLAETPVAESSIADTLAEIVARARSAFQIERPTVSVVHSRDGLPIVRIGSEAVTWLGEAPWYQRALANDIPLIVPDTRDDERFRDEPLVIDEPHVRFFAAIPIDAPGAGRLGAVCVFDQSPRRRADDIDPEQLRHFAEAVHRDFSRILQAHDATVTRGTGKEPNPRGPQAD